MIEAVGPCQCAPPSSFLVARLMRTNARVRRPRDRFPDARHRRCNPGARGDSVATIRFETGRHHATRDLASRATPSPARCWRHATRILNRWPPADRVAFRKGANGGSLPGAD